MKAILAIHVVSSKIWPLHDKQNNKYHTMLTFDAENSVVCLELTPQSGKPWYGKEIIYENEQCFLAEYRQNNCGVDVFDVTDSVIAGKTLNFCFQDQVDNLDTISGYNVAQIVKFMLSIAKLHHLLKTK